MPVPRPWRTVKVLRAGRRANPAKPSGLSAQARDSRGERPEDGAGTGVEGDCHDRRMRDGSCRKTDRTPLGSAPIPASRPAHGGPQERRRPLGCPLPEVTRRPGVKELPLPLGEGWGEGRATGDLHPSAARVFPPHPVPLPQGRGNVPCARVGTSRRQDAPGDGRCPGRKPGSASNVCREQPPSTREVRPAPNPEERLTEAGSQSDGRNGAPVTRTSKGLRRDVWPPRLKLTMARCIRSPCRCPTTPAASTRYRARVLADPRRRASSVQH